MILNVCCLSLSEQDIFFLIRERIEQYFEYLLTTHLKSPVHISILMMKSNPEYEGQIVNKKINVWDEEKTLVSPRAFSPWNLFRLKVFDNSEKKCNHIIVPCGKCSQMNVLSRAHLFEANKQYFKWNVNSVIFNAFRMRSISYEWSGRMG